MLLQLCCDRQIMLLWLKSVVIVGVWQIMLLWLNAVVIIGHLQVPACCCVLQLGEDPFGEQRKEKKARLASQEGRQLKNKQASDKVHGKPALPPTLKLAASLPEHGKGVPTKKRELKLDVSAFFICLCGSTHICPLAFF